MGNLLKLLLVIAIASLAIWGYFKYVGPATSSASARRANQKTQEPIQLQEKYGFAPDGGRVGN